MTDRERFISIYKDKIKRDGADAFLEWLSGDKSDFFTAPASTRYHNNCPGGLVSHSLNVYDCLCDYMSRESIKKAIGYEISDESIAIAGLLHDICKVNFYKTSFRNVKDENGKWVSAPYYTIEDTLPYGHGEKSVYIVSAYMKLTRDEAFAIRYHMGFSGTEDTGNVGRALEMFPLAYATCCADMEAAFLMEGKLAGELNK